MFRLLPKTKGPTKTKAIYSKVSPANPNLQPGVNEAPQENFRQEQSRDIAHRASHQRIKKEVDEITEPSQNQRLLRHLKVLYQTTNTTQRRQP